MLVASMLAGAGADADLGHSASSHDAFGLAPSTVNSAHRRCGGGCVDAARSSDRAAYRGRRVLRSTASRTEALVVVLYLPVAGLGGAWKLDVKQIAAS